MKRTLNSARPGLKEPAHPPSIHFFCKKTLRVSGYRGSRVLVPISLIIIYTSPLFTEQDTTATNFAYALKQLATNTSKKTAKQDQEQDMVQLLTDYTQYLKNQGKRDPGAETLLKNLKSTQKPVKE